MSEGPTRITAQDLVPRLDELPDVKLIGVGGVGCSLARHGALYLASLDADTRLVLVDGDSFEPSNSTRMFFGGDGNKAEVVQQDLVPHLSNRRLTIEAIGEYVSPGNIDELIREGDTVLLAVDNHATRKLVSDFCASRREDVCLISGGNDGVGKDSSGRERRGTAGNCQIYLRRGGTDVTPSLTEFHREVAESGRSPARRAGLHQPARHDASDRVHQSDGSRVDAQHAVALPLRRAALSRDHVRHRRRIDAADPAPPAGFPCRLAGT